jgi:purine catabolism regulator
MAERPKRRPPREDSSSLTQRLRSLGQIASMVNSGTELGDVLKRIVFAICQNSIWSSSAIMALDRESGYSVLVARHDPDFKETRRTRRQWLLATSPTVRVLETGIPLIIADAQQAPDYPDYMQEARQRGYRTVVLIPLQSRDGKGRAMVMSVHAGERRKIDEDELVFLQTAAGLASLAVEKAHHLNAERQQAAGLRRAFDLHAATMESVLAGRSLATIVDLVAEFLPHPILVVDLTSNQVLARRSPLPDRIADGEWAAKLKQNGARELGRVMRAAKPTHFQESQPLVFAAMGIDFTIEAMIEPLLVDGSVLGGMVLFTGGRPLEAFDALLANEARFALAVQLMRAHVRFATQAETNSEFFGRLFSGNWRDEAETMARAGHLGLALDAPARLLVLAPGATADRPPDDNMRAMILRGLLRVASLQHPGAAVCFDGEDAVVFLPERASGEKSATRLIERLLREMEWITGTKPIAALGRLCRELKDYQAARQDCARILDLARRLDRRGLVSEAEFGPFARLLASADQAALRRFVQDTLEPLAAYDRRHRSSFLPTLDAFLTHGCRYQPCADALGIHVTTLRYRLQRLGDLFGIDLEDREARLALDVAFRLRTAIGG